MDIENPQKQEQQKSKKLKIVILLDTTGSMGSIIREAKNVANDILKMCQVFENTSLALVLFNDYDHDQRIDYDHDQPIVGNGILVYDNLINAEQVIDILSKITAKGGGHLGYEAVFTALLKTLDFIPIATDNDMMSGALIYIMTDEGGRFFHNEHEELKQELQCYNNAFSDSFLTFEDTQLKGVAQKLKARNVKVMVLSPFPRAYDVEGFCNLEMAYNSVQEMYRGVQLIVAPDVEKLRLIISTDILCSLTNMDSATTSQSFCGSSVGTLDEFKPFCKKIVVDPPPPHIWNSLLKRCNNVDGISLYQGKQPNKTKPKTDFLHFSIYNGHTSIGRYELLMSDPTTEKVDKLVNRLLNNRCGVFNLVADSESLGGLIRNLVDDFASPSCKTMYNNGVRTRSSSSANAKAQQTQRIARVADSLVEVATDVCNRPEAGGLFYSSLWSGGSFPVIDNPTDFINMTQRKILVWVEDELLKNIRFRPNVIGEEPPPMPPPPSSSSSSSSSSSTTHRRGETTAPMSAAQLNTVLTSTTIMDEKRLHFIPANRFKMSFSDEACVHPAQILSFLVDSKISFKSATGLNTLMMYALVLKNKYDYPQQLIKLAEEFFNEFCFDTYLLTRSEIHSSGIRNSLLHENVIKHIPDNVVTTLMTTLQLSNFLIVLKINEEHKIPYNICKARQRNTSELIKCLGCNVSKYPENFNANDPLKYCCYCSVVRFDLDTAVSQDVTSILPLEPQQQLPSEPMDCSLPRQQLDGVIGKQEGKSLELMCKGCSSFYPVWDATKAPADENKHRCPTCRAVALLKNKKIQNLLAHYVNSKYKLTNPNLTLSVEFIAYNAHHMLSWVDCSLSSDDIRHSLNTLSILSSDDITQSLNTLSKMLTEEQKKLSCKIQQRGGWNEKGDSVEVISLWRNKKIKDFLTTRQVERMFQLQTGVPATVSFLNKEWHNSDNTRSCFNILNGIVANRQYTEEEIVKILDEGLLVTNAEAIKFVKELLPDTVDINEMLKIRECKICYSNENPTVVEHCKNFLICSSCLNNKQLELCPSCREPLDKEALLTKRGKGPSSVATAFAPMVVDNSQKVC